MVTGSVDLNLPTLFNLPPEIPEAEPVIAAKTEKKCRNWSPETRAAASARMKAMQAAKKARRADEAPAESLPAFTEAERRITVPAVRRKSTLTDADWPEIKQMLAAGKTRAAIASDYDEEPEDLDFFVQSCQRREQREGNFAAPLAGA